MKLKFGFNPNHKGARAHWYFKQLKDEALMPDRFAYNALLNRKISTPSFKSGTDRQFCFLDDVSAVASQSPSCAHYKIKDALTMKKPLVLKINANSKRFQTVQSSTPHCLTYADPSRELVEISPTRFKFGRPDQEKGTMGRLTAIQRLLKKTASVPGVGTYKPTYDTVDRSYLSRKRF